MRMQLSGAIAFQSLRKPLATLWGTETKSLRTTVKTSLIIIRDAAGIRLRQQLASQHQQPFMRPRLCLRSGARGVFKAVIRIGS